MRNPRVGEGGLRTEKFRFTTARMAKVVKGQEGRSKVFSSQASFSNSAELRRFNPFKGKVETSNWPKISPI
jgi:hypothetical protein